MNKKYILGIVPFFMLLASCAGVSLKEEENFFVEDTLAHEEIFGSVESSFSNVRKDLPDYVALSTPAIGVQKAVGETTVSIRFVAAIALNKENLEEREAVWTRAMFTDAGANFKVAAEKPSRKAYTALSNGDPSAPSYYTIDDFNAAHGTEYNSFVVYTMLNIPKSTYDDYYLNAYLTLDPDGTPVSSKEVATNVSGTKRVAFAADKEGYFLDGTISGVANSIRNQDAVTSDGDKARFTVPLAANDSFFAVYNHIDATPANSKFLIYDYSKIESGGASASFESDSLKIKAKIARIFVLYVNSSDGIWTDIAPELYINGVKTDYSNIRTSGTDKVQCEVAGLHAGDIVRFRTGEDYLDFYHTDGSDINGGNSYTILADDDYTFYVTSDNRVFYSEVYYKVQLTFDFSALSSWDPATSNYKIHAWNANGDVFTWDSDEESIVDNKYTLISLGKISTFKVYFKQGSVTKESYTVNYGLQNGHSYTITVAPGDPWSDNTFGSGITVNDTTGA